jgi:hypothetical protein
MPRLGCRPMASTRRLEHARGTDERAPNVGDFDPVGFQLRLDPDFAAENGAERCHRGDRGIVRLGWKRVADVITVEPERLPVLRVLRVQDPR